MSCVNYNLKSVPATHYTEAITTGDYEQEYLPGFAGDGGGKVNHIAIKSKERLAWAIEVCDYDGNILAAHLFAEEDGRAAEITESGESVTYYFYDYEVRWGVPQLNGRAVPVNLRNYSSASKTAGTNGAVTVYFVVEKGR